MTVICLVIVEFDFRKSLLAESEGCYWLTVNDHTDDRTDDHAGNLDDPVDHLCYDKIEDLEILKVMFTMTLAD